MNNVLKLLGQEGESNVSICMGSGVSTGVHGCTCMCMDVCEGLDAGVGVCLCVHGHVCRHGCMYVCVHMCRCARIVVRLDNKFPRRMWLCFHS